MTAATTPAPTPVTPEPGQPASGPADGRAPSSRWSYILLTGGLVLMVGPFLWMVLGSLKPAADFLRFPPTFLPSTVTTESYGRLFDQLDFPRFFLNSSVIAFAVTAGTLLFCPMLGYALAKLRWHGKRLVMVLVLATLMVPAGITLIPNFILMSGLGLVNTYPGLILPFLVGPFGVFLMRQFMLGIPDELLEAARMDGAYEFRVFRSVVMPIATPVLATLGILTFLGNWNSFIYPLVMAQEPQMYTLPVALATFATGQYQADHGMLMAGSVILVVPVLIVFVLFQRWITEGIATTGLKG
ncbi:MAG TPA: carbohydrate ABC transporter permease [Candidatus Limnocylindrales bacterium]|nr:carbohydrate ABC transporter permease [Candidatus Limnocylindrales bacterium]